MTIPHFSKEAAVLEVNLFLQSGLDQLTTRVRFCVRFCTTVGRGVLYESIILVHKDSSDVALCKTGENTGNNDQNWVKFFLFLCFGLVRLPVINQDLRKNVVIFFLLSSS